MDVRLSKLEKTYRRNPQSTLFAHLADLYLHKNQVSRALSLCEAGCKLFPNYASGFAILSKCHHARGDLEDARRAQQKALDLDPENPGGLVRLAEIYRDQDRPVQALESLQRAACLDDLNPESKELMDRLTFALRVESTGAQATDLLDNETRLDALALEAEGKEAESDPARDSERDPAAEGIPSAALSTEDGMVLSADRSADLEGTAPRPETEEPAAAEDLAVDFADPGEAADPPAEGGQPLEQNEAAEAGSPPPADDELVHLFQEIENQEERESPAGKTSLPVAAPAASDAHQIPTATLAQIYSDQGLVQRAVATYRQVLEKDPDNKEIKRRLAELE